MRRTLLLTAAVASALTAVPVSAQQRRQPPDTQAQTREDAARARRREREWNENALPLLGSNAAGPCPFVKVLYDAARIVEFKDPRPASSNVAYSGEIEGVTARCAYEGASPIELQLMVTFSAGKGPQATSNRKDFGYWVAVTTRNADVLAKEHFALRVDFPPGTDRVMLTDLLQGITIPRANEKVSGAQFEVLIGFDVTAEQAEFNRSGSRFRVNAGSAVAAAGTTPAQ
jgi:hypothetical protein